ncbi:MAG TPA: hypothetical protein VG675_12605 [Bryobacteraceae bacterium]|nr:hypothetical protein [Bryobacteraceae bacterium]
MAEQITIPISIFEVTVWYQKLAVRLLVDRAELVQTLFDAFSDLKPNADDLEVISTGKTTEQGIRLRLPQGIILFFGAAGCKFTKEAATWADADSILGHLQTFLAILTNGTGIVLGRKVTVLTLHLQPKNVSFKQILLPFITDKLRNLDPAPLDAMAVVSRWPGRRITIDGSAQLANGIFLQMEREFQPDITLDQIKQNIFDDEVNFFRLLNVEEVDA